MALVMQEFTPGGGPTLSSYTVPSGTAAADTLQLVHIAGRSTTTPTAQTDTTGGFTTLRWETFFPLSPGSSRTAWWWWGWRIVRAGDPLGATVTLSSAVSITTVFGSVCFFTGFVETPTPFAGPMATVNKQADGSPVSVSSTATALCLPIVMFSSPGGGGGFLWSPGPPNAWTPMDMTGYLAPAGTITRTVWNTNYNMWAYSNSLVLIRVGPGIGGWSIGTAMSSEGWSVG